MKLHELIDRAYRAFLRYAEESRVVLLHPQSRYRSVLIAKLIKDAQQPAYYYALGPDDIELRTFIEGITHDLANQHATFGRHLNMLPHRVYDDFESHIELVLDTFVRELEELSDEDFFFILDEYDRSDDADDIQRFVERLADRLPPNCRLVINSRTLPRLPWVSMIAKRQAALLLDDQLIERNFYQLEEVDAYQLEVFALGPGYVLFDQSPVETWEGHLPRLLFFFALDRPIVTRSEICHAFWPELDADQAVNVFHVTKRRLHKALGKDILVHNDSHYRVNPEFNVYYDVTEFVETLMRGRDPNNPDPFEDWQRAARLYRGPFLQGHDDKWIVRRREAFRAGYLEALSAMADRWISQDRKELALRLYKQGIDEDIRREDFHRHLMLLYNDLGRRSEAVAHYQNLEKRFKKQGWSLEPDTVSAYNEITA
jgi:DNA-binding SARP family transcriptional activator